MPASEVTLGVRPEDLHIASDADPAELTLDAVVEVVERLGSEILLDIAVGRVTMVASVEPTATAKVHERLRLGVNPHRMHFFDDQHRKRDLMPAQRLGDIRAARSNSPVEGDKFCLQVPRQPQIAAS